MTKKVILHIAKYYAPDEGGIETVAKYLAEGMHSFRNVVVCYSTNGHNCHDNINGIEVYRVKVNFRISSQDIALGYFNELKKIIGIVRPNIINIHCPNPFVYPIAIHLAPKGCKIVLLWHADILSKGWMYKVIKPIETLALKRADLIMATSPNYIDDSSPIYKYKNKVKVAQNGIVTQEFQLENGDKEKIEEIKKKYHYKKIILFVGRHVPYKGIDKLIEAEKYITSDCIILIAGQGRETPHLKELANSPRIEFLGKVPQRDLRCYYYAADIFGFSSVNKAEAFGVALAEAMYCKCVPVTFHLKGSGVNWVNINNETGLEVPLNDVKAYAHAIDKLLKDDNLRARMADAAKKRIEDFFTEKTAAEKVEEVLSML